MDIGHDTMTEYVLEYQTPSRTVWYQSKRISGSEEDALGEWKAKSLIAEGAGSGIVYRLVKVTKEVIAS